MNITERINILQKLKTYLLSNNDEWQQVKQEAQYKNAWFTQEFINTSIQNICTYFLEEKELQKLLANYAIANDTTHTTVGIVMAGNIPLVSFHDFLCVFISGHKMRIKPSSKDEVLIKHIVKVMNGFNNEIYSIVQFGETLKNCDAYIATGSNNSSRYFEYYFNKYPHIIRRNRTSVALLNGTETNEELALLANDIQLYFGQGCRNVTHLFVPKNYDFTNLLSALKQYNSFIDLHKYKHNYDYQLALLMMNNKFYMTDGSVILTENDAIFSAISVVHFSYYDNETTVETQLQNNNDVQCVVGKNHIPFGKAQQPNIFDFADGVDVMKFLCNLKS